MGSLVAQTYGAGRIFGAGAPRAPPVQSDVGRQLRVFWTGAEGQALSGLATVVQEAAGMANVRFVEGGEDRWYTLRKESMTIAEDGSRFEWADRAYPAHPAYPAACPPHPNACRGRPYHSAPLIDGAATGAATAAAAAAAAARRGRPAVHKGVGASVEDLVASGGAAAEYLARHMVTNPNPTHLPPCWRVCGSVRGREHQPRLRAASERVLAPAGLARAVL